MVEIIDCPICSEGKLKIEIAKGYKIITDGVISKLPCKKHCKSCNRDIRYIVVREQDYDSMLKWLHTKE